jgi:hypothetical protein
VVRAGDGGRSLTVADDGRFSSPSPRPLPLASEWKGEAGRPKRLCAHQKTLYARRMTLDSRRKALYTHQNEAYDRSKAASEY